MNKFEQVSSLPPDVTTRWSLHSGFQCPVGLGPTAPAEWGPTSTVWGGGVPCTVRSNVQRGWEDPSVMTVHCIISNGHIGHVFVDRMTDRHN